MKYDNVKSEDLERWITHLDTCYELGYPCTHPDTGVLVSDAEYDAMRLSLANLKPDSEIFKTVTSSLHQDDAVKKVQHDPPMTSIDKAYHEDLVEKEKMLVKWLKDRQPANSSTTTFNVTGKSGDFSYPEKYFCQSYKLDGVACGVYYKNGKLVSAGLRPRDGVNGEDVTEQIKYVSGIPQTLMEPITCSIRGEIICTLSDFDKVQKDLEDAGEDLRANPRNHAAGAIRNFKEPEKVRDLRLSFIGYTIEGQDNPPYKNEIERAKYANQKLGVRFIRVNPFNFYDLDKMEAKVHELNYEVDGVVISVNNLEDQEQAGRSGDKATGNPKGKIAWKFKEEEAKATIASIEWKTGRTGAIKPVAVFDKAVRLAGTNVSRATLHNYGFMLRNKIDVGTVVTVVKAGKIIPKVVGVVSGQCQNDPDYPKVCPASGGPTALQQGATNDMWELVSVNPPENSITGLVHYLEKVGVLGLGESRVQQLVDAGVVKNPADFYRLDVPSCLKSGLTQRQALLAIAAIHMLTPDKDDEKLSEKIENARNQKKKIDLFKVLAGLGIKNCGETASKVLVSHFGSISAIRVASEVELEEVEDFGSLTAKNVYEGLIEKKEIIDDLLQYIDPQLPKVGKLTGKTFVLSGKVDKRTLKDKIEGAGGKISGSVGKKTDYLIAGDGSGSKSEKAAELGIAIISPEDLDKLL